MKRTLIAAALFLGFSATGFSQMAEGRCMKCKKQVEIQNMEEVVMKNGLVTAKTPVSATEFVYLLQSTHEHKFVSLPTTAQLNIGERVSLTISGYRFDGSFGFSEGTANVRIDSE